MTNSIRGIYRIFDNFLKKNRNMSTCNWLVLERLRSRPIVIEVPTPDQNPIGNLKGTKILMRLEPIASAITHVMVLSAKVRRNEWIWYNLDIHNMLGPTFGLKNSQFFQYKE